jgi:hyperosmotically inducible protein
VTSRVEQALLGDERLRRLQLTVLTRKNDVLLTGFVDNQNYIDDVNKLVRDIEGVHTLHNHLSVQK